MLRYTVPVICMFGFAVLMGAMLTGFTTSTDFAIREAIHRLASDNLTELSNFLSFVGSSPVWLAAVIPITAGLWLADRAKQALGLAVCMSGALVLENILKLALHRVRPEVFFGASPGTYAFPSGHALFAICLYGAFAIIITADCASILKRVLVWCVAAVVVLEIGLSRIYLGVHYPSDVLAGYFAGAAWLAGLSAAGAFTAPGTTRKDAAR